MSQLGTESASQQREIESLPDAAPSGDGWQTALGGSGRAGTVARAAGAEKQHSLSLLSLVKGPEDSSPDR